MQAGGIAGVCRHVASNDRAWADGSWETADGLTLHYRDYAGRADRPPVLCLPGLTRNARDFEPVADAFAGGWRFIVVELRGRGESDYARDPASYVPQQYVADVAALIEREGLHDAVLFGTSLGGLMAMMLNAAMPGSFSGFLINDIGPEIAPAGLDRIRNTVGQGRSYPTWMHAARALQDMSGDAYPDYAISDWLAQSKRLMCLSGNGRIAFDYDMKIAEPFAQVEEQTGALDLWPLFRALGDRPLLAIRGELSDLLSAETFARMAREVPSMHAVTVPRVGHPPTLAEAEAQQAIGRLLDAIA